MNGHNRLQVVQRRYRGTEERQAFAEHYGGYIEMTYLIGGRRFKVRGGNRWSLDKYLFLGVLPEKTNGRKFKIR
jgi:hypothetical protein